jgi:hypothetical protein
MSVCLLRSPPYIFGLRLLVFDDIPLSTSRMYIVQRSGYYCYLGPRDNSFTVISFLRRALVLVTFGLGLKDENKHFQTAAASLCAPSSVANVVRDDTLLVIAAVGNGTVLSRNRPSTRDHAIMAQSVTGAVRSETRSFQLLCTEHFTLYDIWASKTSS